METYFMQRYSKVWDSLDDKERNIVHLFQKYVSFVRSYFYDYPTKTDYERFVQWIIREHLNMLEEAFDSLLLGHLISSACLIRVIIENYVLFYYVKKYRKQEVWKDYKVWSCYHLTSAFMEEPRKSKIMQISKEYANEEDLDLEMYDAKGSYSWLSRVCPMKQYTFKKVSSFVKTSSNKDVYKDFIAMSRFVHHNDFVTKIDFFDSIKLLYFISFLVTYTDEVLQLFDKRSLRGRYQFLLCDLLSELDEVNEIYKKQLKKLNEDLV